MPSSSHVYQGSLPALGPPETLQPAFLHSHVVGSWVGSHRVHGAPGGPHPPPFPDLWSGAPTSGLEKSQNQLRARDKKGGLAQHWLGETLRGPVAPMGWPQGPRVAAAGPAQVTPALSPDPAIWSSQVQRSCILQCWEHTSSGSPTARSSQRATTSSCASISSLLSQHHPFMLSHHEISAGSSLPYLLSHHEISADSSLPPPWSPHVLFRDLSPVKGS